MAHSDLDILDLPPATLTTLLASRAHHNADELAYAFLSDGTTIRDRYTYAELDVEARRIAGLLRADRVRGEPVLLLYAPGLEYVAAFFGCLYAGAIAVPAYPPHRNRSLDRLRSIVRDSGARVVLCSAAVRDSIARSVSEAPELQLLHWIATDAANAQVEPYVDFSTTADTLAFLQYTSGSTSAPKGVMITHGNLFHNAASIEHGFQFGNNTTTVFWLPLYHDMGLIGGVLQPMQIGRTSYLMAPATFLSRPIRWLQAISHFRATVSGAPNFAYELCTAKATPEQIAELDLSTWRVAFNGAEPIRAETLARFAKTFEPSGFRPAASYPCYGLAESTLIVTGGQHDHPPVILTLSRTALERNRIAHVPANHADAQSFVGCGAALLDQQVLIVDPDTMVPCSPDRPGEIWVAGPSVAQGYWKRPELSASTFAATTATGDGPYLRTGDLGFLHNGELFVTGRIKDLIILRGRNHYPQDIEHTVEQSHTAIRLGCCAAISVEDESGERLVIVAEVERSERNVRVDDVAVQVRSAIAEHHDVTIESLVLLRPGSVPKTSSGKIQRHACKAGFLDDSLAVVGRWDAAAALPSAPTTPGGPDSSAIRAWLVERVSTRLRIPADSLDPRQPLARFGLDSLTAVQLAGELEEWLGHPISPVVVYDHPTIDDLARYLAGDVETPRTSETRAAGAEIAIVGIGCRFPGAAGPAAFWNLLRDGIDAIADVPGDRWDADALFSADPTVPGTVTTRRGGFLPAIDRFDRAFFGISPREAARMDPQQRLLLETTWEALEDAGLDADRLAGQPVGVFVGIASNDYGRLQAADPADIDAYVGTGNALSIAANRLSFAFDFNGPSLAIDTACSSSLVAVHLACQSVRRGESTMAVAAGVNVILTPDLTINFSRANMMAPDGRCKAFDAAADGYVRSEGVGVVILKPLQQARADGDRVYAVIRGSAVNQDGRSNGLTAPNRLAQEAVLRAAYADAGVCPGDVDAIEAHGTGTSLGDPIEALALGNVIGDGRAANRVAWLGSVKTNIGHLEAAAGVAGLIKTALALHHGELPPSLHFQKANPHIPFEKLPLRVATQRESLRPGDRPAVAGVSSFGFGGTNAHVVLQAVAAAPATEASEPCAAQLVVLSAKSPEALASLAQSWIDVLADSPVALADLAFTAARRRSQLDHRLAIAAASRESLNDQLRAFRAETPRAGTSTGRRIMTGEPRVAFVFSGQGPQWSGMGRDLYSGESVFRAAIDRCDDIFRPLAGWSVRDALLHEADAARFDETDGVQPMLFAVQIALAELWQSWGIRPAAVVGHSLGEAAAAHVAGALTLSEAIRVVFHRSRLQHTTYGRGKMAAVALSADESREALRGFETSLSVAAINGPRSCVWAGDPAALDAALQPLRKRDVFHRLLNGQVAFHSPHMDSLRAELVTALADLKPQAGSIPIVSTVTGQTISGDSFTAAYWGRNLREPVAFATAAQALIESGIDAFLEIGPHPVLAEPLQQCAKESSRPVAVLTSLRRREDGRTTLLATLGSLYALGAPIAWDRVAPSGQLVSLPNYPWQRERCWHESTPAASTRSIRKETESPAAPTPHDGWLIRLNWDSIAAPTPMGSLAGTWLVVGDNRASRNRLPALVREKGGTIVAVSSGQAFQRNGPGQFTLDHSDPEQWRRLLRDAIPSIASLRGVIHLGALSNPATDGLCLNDLATAQERGCIGVLHLVQALVAHGATPRLWLVTRGAQAVRETDGSAAANAPIWGFGRVLAREHPELRTTLIDLDPTPRSADFDSLVSLLGSEIEDDQIAARDGQLFAARLGPAAADVPNNEPRIRADATYLITGGLGGLGLAVASWLVEHGARHLALISRRGETPDVEPHLAKLRERGVTVLTPRTDVADAESLADVLAEIDQALPPLRGVVHAAGVLDDGIALHLNRERMWNVLTPKMLGAWNLHAQTSDRALDFFVMFSSAAALLGSPGQANYAAANAFLDGLAQHRRARGLPAVSINWGPWSELGMAARGGREAKLAGLGMGSIDPESGLTILGRLLSAPMAQIGVLPIDTAMWRRLATAGQAPAYFAAMAGDSAAPAADATTLRAPSALDRAALAAVPPDDWQPILECQLREQAARVLRLDAAALDIDQPLSNLGIDSLMAIELKNRIEGDLGATVPMVMFLEGPSVRDLAGYLAEQLAPLLTSRRGTPIKPSSNGHCSSPSAPSTLGADDAGHLLARLDSLSEAEVDSLLLELAAGGKGD